MRGCSSLVSVGMGIAIVPKSLQRTPVRNVVYRPLADVPTAEMALAWRKSDRTQITKAFIELSHEPLHID